MKITDESLKEAIRIETLKPVPPAIAAAAAVVRGHVGQSAAAVLFYGSCRREEHANGVVDFYVLVDSYLAVHERHFRAGLNVLLPPNVYYLELPFEDTTVRVKYSVISLPQFRRRTAHRGFDPVIWVRFCQPCSIIYARDGVGDVVIDALANAARVMIGEAVPLMRERFTASELWMRAFSETYRTEIRAERSNRGGQLYENDAAYYDQIAGAVLGGSGSPQCGERFAASASALARYMTVLRWRIRRVVGKSLAVVRHVKAAFTFEGGIDYVLWKIERHSGVRLPITPWQRRHPLLAAPVLFWRHYRRGVFR